MSRYFSPVSAIETRQVGRFLDAYDFQSGKAQLQTGEHLYALCDKLIYKFAVCVDDPGDFDHFRNQYHTGHLMSFDLIALSEEYHQSAS